MVASLPRLVQRLAGWGDARIHGGIAYASPTLLSGVTDGSEAIVFRRPAAGNGPPTKLKKTFCLALGPQIQLFSDVLRPVPLP